MADIAPYDPFTFLNQVALLFTGLSPEIQQWIKERTELRQQRIMMARVRHLKHYCRTCHLKPADILIEIKLTFKDLSAEDQISLAQLMDDELDQ